MKILTIILGVALGIILAIAFVFLFIYIKLRSSMRKFGFKVNTIGDMKAEMEKIRQEDSTRARSISGMTSILLPNIRNDFPEFNEQELYTKAETSLRQIFQAIEKKDISEVKSMPLMQSSIEKIIEDYETAEITESYDDIKFHRFAIYQYDKKDGMATVTISTSLEYYYQKKKQEKILKDFTKYKKQTKYQCTFVYVYDEAKVEKSAKVLAINCPNCGAAIKALGHKYCDYCGTTVKEVNLRSWELSSYQEI